MDPKAAIPDPMPTPGQPSRLGPITRRLVYTLALFSIITATSFAGAGPLEDLLRLKWFDDLRCINSLFAVLWVAGMLIIWRRAVVWTPRRKWLTSLVCLMPFLQVVYGRPWWTPPPTGWLNLGLSDLGMRIGQAQLEIGCWIWLITWIWWGREFEDMQNGATHARVRHGRMTATGRRLVASFAMLPILFGTFLLTYQAIRSLAAKNNPDGEALAITAIVAVVFWIMTWRRATAWSRTVLWKTTLLTVLLIAVPVGAFWIHKGRSFESVVLALAFSGWGIWLMVTVSIWPSVERIDLGGRATPRCLRCGYLLTGLTATRCPECGDEPTIDVLWQATAGEL